MASRMVLTAGAILVVVVAGAAWLSGSFLGSLGNESDESASRGEDIERGALPPGDPARAPEGDVARSEPAPTRPSREGAEKAPDDPSEPAKLPIDPDAPPNFAAQLESETVDPDWAPQIEAAISQALDDDSLRGATLGNIDCRRTVCEFTVTHPNEAAQKAFSAAFTRRSPPHEQLAIRAYGDEVEGYGSLVNLVKPGARVAGRSAPSGTAQ